MIRVFFRPNASRIPPDRLIAVDGLFEWGVQMWRSVLAASGGFRRHPVVQLVCHGWYEFVGQVRAGFLRSLPNTSMEQIPVTVLL